MANEKKLSAYSPRDRALIKSALRRAFARSDLHAEVMAEARIEHYDEKAPRCRKYSVCAACGSVEKTWTCSVDHLEEVVPVIKTLEDMTIAELAERIFCDKTNLQVLDEACHNRKTAQARALRPKRKGKKKA